MPPGGMVSDGNLAIASGALLWNKDCGRTGRSEHRQVSPSPCPGGQQMNIFRGVKKLMALRDEMAELKREQQLAAEQQLLTLGKILSEGVKAKGEIGSLSEVEFKIFSQWGDDGIIQWLLNNLDFPNKTFIEFGVENYREANTRFLMMNDNWSGLVMDGSESHVAQIVNSEYYWKYQLSAKTAFIETANVNGLIESSNFEREVGILHIDLDGNDYWIWKEITCIAPIVVILEYNSIFGIDRAITTPYDPAFFRTRSHHSNLYFGASLRALQQLSAQKGYAFIGCTGAGNNAYFVRRDKLGGNVVERSLAEGYVLSKVRESRDPQGRLTYVSGNDRIELIRGMPVYNVDTERIENL